MVYVPHPSLAGDRPSYLEAYNSILKSHRRAPLTSASSVNILVAPNVDSLCAARMLATLFKQDDIAYRIVPLSGPDEFQDFARELKKNPDLHTLLLINMGGTVDLCDSEWFGEFDYKVNIHVIDSTRPLDLNNLFLGGESGSRIWIWDDGDAEKLVEERKSWELTTYNPDPKAAEEDSENGSDHDEESEEEEEEEEEEEFSDEDEANLHSDTKSPNKKRKKTSRNGTRKRRRTEEPSSITIEEFQFHESRLDRYYEHGASYGQSAASTMYILATLLERVDNDFLWLAIMGLTYQYITSRISRQTYETYHTVYFDEVSRLNPNLNATEGINSAINPDDTSVRTSDELRFMLFRHWNLYDAMFHSSYVASKLGIWKERGRQRLTGLLAKMGFSIPQTQQPYSHMDMDLKRSLIDKLNNIAPEYGLVELSYPSFTRSYGFHSHPLSAADAVEGISALLDVAGGTRMEVEIEGMRNGGEWFGGGRTWEGLHPEKATQRAETDPSTKPVDEVRNGPNENGAAAEKHVQELAWWVKNFWTAYDALSDIRALKGSLSLAMALQRAIIRQGTSIIDKQDIRTMRNHRVVILTQGPDLHLFCNPGILSRLALWLVDALRDRLPGTVVGTSSRKKSLPLVLACLDEPKARYTLIGVLGALEFGQVRKNQFSLTFLKALDATETYGQYGGFDTNIVSLEQKDLSKFLQGLCR